MHNSVENTERRTVPDVPSAARPSRCRRRIFEYAKRPNGLACRSGAATLGILGFRNQPDKHQAGISGQMANRPMRAGHTCSDTAPPPISFGCVPNIEPEPVLARPKIGISRVAVPRADQVRRNPGPQGRRAGRKPLVSRPEALPAGCRLPSRQSGTARRYGWRSVRDGPMIASRPSTTPRGLPRLFC